MANPPKSKAKSTGLVMKAGRKGQRRDRMVAKMRGPIPRDPAEREALRKEIGAYLALYPMDFALNQYASNFARRYSLAEMQSGII